MAGAPATATARLRLSLRSGRVGASCPARPLAPGARRACKPAVAPHLLTRAQPDKTPSVVDNLTFPFRFAYGVGFEFKDWIAYAKMKEEHQITVKQLGEDVNREREVVEQLEMILARK